MNAPRRLAPAFQMEVRAPFLWRGLAVLLWGLALLALCTALAAQARGQLGPAADRAFWVLAALLLPLLCWQVWKRSAGQAWQLLWDGQRWSLRPGAARAAAVRDEARRPVHVQVAMDLDSFLLLRCHAAGDGGAPTVFLPLLRREHRSVWLPLRWALFSARALPADPA